MKLYDLVLKEVERLGGSDALLRRMWRPPFAPFLAWVLPKLVDPEANVDANCAAFLALVDNEIDRHHFIYGLYRVRKEPLYSLQKRPDYAKVRETLEKYYPAPKLWDDLLPYAYKRGFDLCIELLYHEERVMPRDIAVLLRSQTYSRVYKVLYKQSKI